MKTTNKSTFSEVIELIFTIVVTLHLAVAVLCVPVVTIALAT